MPSVHKREGSPYWFCAYYLPDGRRSLRSTKCRKKNDAIKVCFKYAEASDLARDGRLLEGKAREVISDIYAIGNRGAMPEATVRAYITEWLKVKELEVRAFAEYDRVGKAFLAFLGAKADKPMDTVSPADVTAWRGKLADVVSGSTVNKNLKLIRGAFSRAVRDGVIRDNPFVRVGMVKTDKQKRRALTLPELQTVLKHATGDWVGIILAGVYTGQRLGDIANLTWQQIDLEAKEVRFTTQKTGKALALPIAEPLFRFLLDHPAGDKPSDPVFPSTYGKPTNSNSHTFTDLLADAGLGPRSTHRRTRDKDEPTRRRNVSGLSFHCLRHTATSLLKNAGISDVVAREIIGHDTEAVSRAYTHIDYSTLKTAIGQLPDITSEATK